MYCRITSHTETVTPFRNYLLVKATSFACPKESTVSYTCGSGNCPNAILAFANAALLLKSTEEENIPIYVTAKTYKRTMKGMKANS